MTFRRRDLARSDKKWSCVYIYTHCRYNIYIYIMIITSSMLGIFMDPSAGILLGFINSRLRNCARPYLDILASHLSCGSRRLGVNNFKHLWRPFLWLNLQYLRVTPQFLLIELQFWRLTFRFLLVFAGDQPLLPWLRGDGSAKPGEVSVEGLGSVLAGLGGGGQVQAPRWCFTFCSRWLKRNAQTW